MKIKNLLALLVIISVSVCSLAQNLAPVTFDWEKTNADRFVNSPCYKTLGFNPFSDPQEQEKRYRECEEAKNKEDMEKYLKIGLGILLVGGFGGAIIYNFNKPKEKKA